MSNESHLELVSFTSESEDYEIAIANNCKCGVCKACRDRLDDEIDESDRCREAIAERAMEEMVKEVYGV